jgi:hypothetical protein
MPDKFDPYRESLVVEVHTVWPAELAELPEAERLRIETELHADPAQAAQLAYVRVHTGFRREITVTDDDLARVGH